MRATVFIDQMGRTVSLNNPPQRIISLVPSQTELLVDLGLQKQLAGITKFCIHPNSHFKSASKVGGTKKINIETIKKLKPDLIIGNKEENEQFQIEELMEHFPVWMSDIHTLEDALDMIHAVGELTEKQSMANSIAQRISSGFAALRSECKKSQRAAYFVWKDPYMVAGKKTFIDDMLSRAGFVNITNLLRYPVLSFAELKELDPDVIFLSSEPYPFKDVHVSEMKTICSRARTVIVDGEMFSWYGSRLLQAPSYFRALHEYTT